MLVLRISNVAFIFFSLVLNEPLLLFKNCHPYSVTYMGLSNDNSVSTPPFLPECLNLECFYFMIYIILYKCLCL